jgi:hypothetical protein
LSALDGATTLLRYVESAFCEVGQQDADVMLTLTQLFLISLQSLHATLMPESLLERPHNLQHNHNNNNNNNNNPDPQWPAAIGRLLVSSSMVLVDNLAQDVYQHFQVGPLSSNRRPTLSGGMAQFCLHQISGQTDIAGHLETAKLHDREALKRLHRIYVAWLSSSSILVMFNRKVCYRCSSLCSRCVKEERLQGETMSIKQEARGGSWRQDYQNEH